MAVVRAGFGKQLDANDIYEHLTEPSKLLLLQDDERILAMASYNTKYFMGIQSLIVEGVAMLPEVQGMGIFSDMTEYAMATAYRYVCLRTQNPRMFKALDNLCKRTYPCKKNLLGNLGVVKGGFIRHLGCDVTENGVVKGYHEGLLYGDVPHHKDVDPLFKELGVDINNGDVLLAIGEL